MIIFGLKEDIINYSEVKHFYFFLRFGLTVNQLKRNLLNDLYETELSSMEFDLGSDMLISCQFNGNLCSETNWDFKRFWNNIYGNCYTFNGGNNSYLSGDQIGLHLEMIVSKYKKQFKRFYMIF